MYTTPLQCLWKGCVILFLAFTSLVAAYTAVMFAGEAESGISLNEAQNLREIKLRDIWAVDMPNTRPLPADPQEMTKQHKEEARLVRAIQRLLSEKEKGRAGPVLLVKGKELAALGHVHRLLLANNQNRSEFSEEDELTLFFHAQSSARKVHLTGVKQEGGSIILDYRFEPKLDAGLTRHFALVPLGKLKPDTYKVILQQQPMRQQFQQLGIFELPLSEVKRIICQPILFSIASTDTKKGE